MAACSGERELHFFHHRNSSETFQQLVTSKKQMGNRTSLNLCPRESHSVVHFHSLLLVLMVRSSANDDLMNGMICKYTVVLEVKEIILKADIATRQGAKNWRRFHAMLQSPGQQGQRKQATN